MTGQELLDLLKEMTPEQLALDIRIATPTHDHWKTMLAEGVMNVEEGFARPTEMYQEDEYLTDQETGHMSRDEKDELKKVLIIR